MMTPAESFGPLGIVRSTLLRRWPSVETMRALEPSLSKNTPLRWNRVSSFARRRAGDIERSLSRPQLADRRAVTEILWRRIRNITSFAMA
jgi:hypothetical protein